MSWLYTPHTARQALFIGIIYLIRQMLSFLHLFLFFFPKAAAHIANEKRINAVVLHSLQFCLNNALHTIAHYRHIC